MHSDTLSGRAARRESIVQEMSAHMIVHFIGHGKWDADNPGSSGILLEDGVLSVEDMLRGNLETYSPRSSFRIQHGGKNYRSI